MSRRHLTLIASAISVLAVFAVFLMASTVVQACTPETTLSPSSCPPGTSVLVTGTGFTPHEWVTVTHFETTTKEYTSSSGGFAFIIKVPTTAIVGKTCTVTATGTGRESACASVRVTCLFVTPESPIGPLAALGACFGALLVYKRKSLPHLHLNIHS